MSTMPGDELVDQTVAAILATHHIMAISTVRPDGWPQTTIVGYANDGPIIYFVIFRGSQKFANIAAEPRVSMAVGDEPPDMRLARALYAGAIASEVTDAGERRQAWELLKHRHSNLVGTPMPDPDEAAIMRARCQHLSVVDYTKGLGHTDAYDLLTANEDAGRRHLAGEVASRRQLSCLTGRRILNLSFASYRPHAARS